MGKPRVRVNAGPVGVSFGAGGVLVFCGALAVIGLITSMFQEAGHDPKVAVVLIVIGVTLVGLGVFAAWWHRRELRRLRRR